MSMTEQEAINTLEAMKKQFLGEARDVLDMAIMALEKQIPKKIEINNIPKTSWTKATTKYVCPSCDMVIGFNGLNYCSVCGQKLDWSVNE